MDRVAKAVAVVLHAARRDADPDLVWQVLTDEQQALYRDVALAAVTAYLVAVADFGHY